MPRPTLRPNYDIESYCPGCKVAYSRSLIYCPTCGQTLRRLPRRARAPEIKEEIDVSYIGDERVSGGV